MGVPLVSVCIPNRNYGHLLPQAVASALQERHVPLEVIVVDDASTDASLEELKAFSDPRLRVHVNSVPLGRAANINRAVGLARGKYVTIVPSDDWLLPSAIGRRLSVLEANPAVGYVFCGVLLVDETGKEVGRHIPSPEAYVRSGTEELPRLVRGNYVYTVSALMRRDTLLRLGGVSVDVAPSHRDWHLFLRFLTAGDVAFVPDVLVAERCHAGNATLSISQEGIHHVASVLVLRSLFRELRWTLSWSETVRTLEESSLREVARAALHDAVAHLAEGRRGDARRVLGMALMAWPDCARAPGFWGRFLATCLPQIHLTRMLLGARLQRRTLIRKNSGSPPGILAGIAERRRERVGVGQK